MTSLDEVRKAAQTMKAKALSLKDKSILSIVEQLSSNLTLLELSSPSSKLLENLCLQFRKPLTPLYSILTAHACRFAAILFAFIHENKVEQAKVDEAAFSWENVLNAILAGLLDYLEESSAMSGSNKSTVASSFLALLCRIYFPSTTPRRESGSVLKCTVYILLCDLITGHPENQQELRNVYLSGGKLLGLALSRSRVYVAIEALLELFAGLLPKKGYTEFLNHVFDPKLFSSYQMLKSVVGQADKVDDWEQVSRQICQVLADMNIEYPQPFRIIRSSITGTSPSPVGELYVDDKGLTSNIVEDDAYETFHVPYLIIEDIRYYSFEHSPTCTTFTFKLKSTPTVGSGAANEIGEVIWTIEIERPRLQAFLNTLKARNLLHLFDRHERKLSKIDDDLSLELPTSSRTLPEMVQQFCDFPSESALPASPMVVPEDTVEPQISPSSPLVALPARTEIYKEPSEEADPGLDYESCKLEHSSKQAVNEVKGLKRAASRSPDPPSSKRKPLNGSEGRNQRPQPSRNKPGNVDSRDTTRVFVQSPKMTKRYGKKPRISSPEPPLDGESDYEEIPAPQVSKKSKRIKAIEQKLTGVATSRKGGRKALASPPQHRLRKEPRKGPDNKHNNDARENMAQDSRVVEIVDPHEHQPRRSARVKEQGKPKPDYRDTSVEDQGQVVQVVLSCGSKEEEENKKAESESFSGSEGVTAAGTEGLAGDVEIFYQDIVVPLKSNLSDKSSDQVSRKGQTPTTIDLTLNDEDKPQLQSNKRKRSGRITVIEVTPRSSEEEPKQDGKTKKEVEVMEVEDEEDATVVHEEPQQKFPWSPDQPQRAVKLDIVKANDPRIMAPKARDKRTTAVKPIQLEQQNIRDDITTQNTQATVSKASSSSSNRFSPNIAIFNLKAARASFEATTSNILAQNSSLKPVQEEPIEHFSSPKAAEHHLPVVPSPSRTSFLPAVVPRPTKIDLPEGLSPLPRGRTQRITGLGDSLNSKSLQEATVIQNPSTARDRSNIVPPDKNIIADIPPVPSKPPHASNHPQRFQIPITAQQDPPPTEPTMKKRPVQVPSSTPHGPKSAVYTRRRESGLRRSLEYNDPVLDFEEKLRYNGKEKKTADIVDVLNDIQQVLINKVSKRILNVKTEVRAGRDDILRNAAADIEEMRTESASCFNGLFDLDSEYSSYSRVILERLQDVNRINVTISRKLEEVLEHHDRNTLSKSFPKTLHLLTATLTNPQL
ncbi:hypothetical protein L218DRAFT_958048 [Marasmius fiardii PR-910]|nr:hypothetical protein L218DRAFT_958048 [Marasmius fiardii PR-910]